MLQPALETTRLRAGVTLRPPSPPHTRTASLLPSAARRPRSWSVEPFTFWRDLCAFSLALLAILSAAARGSIGLRSSLLFLLLYLGYIACVVGLPRLGWAREAMLPVSVGYVTINSQCRLGWAREAMLPVV